LGDADEVETVRRIFKLKISGYGYRAIANALNLERVPCAKRGKWRNLNQMWSAGTIQSILLNPAYCGDRAYNRHPLSRKRINEANILGKTKERWISDEGQWTIHRDAHPAIVSREDFDKANGSRKLSTRSNQHQYESPYLLTKLVKCSRCGFNFQGQSYREANAFYYVDGGHMNKGKSVCERNTIRREKLEGFVLDFIRASLSMSLPGRRLEEMMQAYLEQRTNDNPELGRIDQKIIDIDKKLTNLLGMVERGVQLDTIWIRLKELEDAKSKLQYERRKNDRMRPTTVNVKDVSKMAAEFLQNFERHFGKAPIQERKQMIRQIVLGVRVDPEKRIATCAITRIPMVNRALTALVNPSEFLNSGHLVGADCSGGGKRGGLEYPRHAKRHTFQHNYGTSTMIINGTCACDPPPLGRTS
jgi:site-specific DNA recombinase